MYCATSFSYFHVFLHLFFSRFQHHLLERRSHHICLRGAAHLLCNFKVSPEELFDNEQSSGEQWCTPVTFMWFENCSMKDPTPHPSSFPSTALCSSLKCVYHRMFAETARSGLFLFFFLLSVYGFCFQCTLLDLVYIQSKRKQQNCDPLLLLYINMLVAGLAERIRK